MARVKVKIGKQSDQLYYTGEWLTDGHWMLRGEHVQSISSPSNSGLPNGLYAPFGMARSQHGAGWKAVEYKIDIPAFVAKNTADTSKCSPLIKTELRVHKDNLDMVIYKADFDGRVVYVGLNAEFEHILDAFQLCYETGKPINLLYGGLAGMVTPVHIGNEDCLDKSGCEITAEEFVGLYL